MRGTAAFLLVLLLPLCAASADRDPVPSPVGVEEKLGTTIPVKAAFTDDEGSAVTLGQLLGRPTILALVYYRCPNICDYLLTNLAGSLTSLSADAGTLFNVISISINDAETTADARRAKHLALETIQAPFPSLAWRFLTGDAANIAAVSDAVGFRFTRTGELFNHPVAIIVLSPAGRVVRYIYGEAFLPAELRLSLLEAEKGLIGPSIAKVLRICFAVDPASHKFVFKTLQVAATVTFLVAGALVLYLVLSGRRRRRRDA
jgi:protein SCO1/2